MIKCVYPNIVAQMYVKGMTIADMARAIDKSYDTTRKKLCGVSEIFVNEAFKINDLFPDVDFKTLFTRVDNVTQNSA